MSIPNPPASLKHLLPYLKHAVQLEKIDPIMSYFCRYYAVQQGVQQRNASDNESKVFLVTLMDQMEQQKASIGPKLDEPGMGPTHVKNFALRVFKTADDEDRAGKANKNTALSFFAAAQFFEVLTQFGELPPDIQEKQKYAKWKAADINAALKKGLTPKPGGPNEQVSDELSSSTQETNSSSSSSAFPEFPSPPSNTAPSSSSLTSSQNAPSFPSFPDIPSSSSSSAFPSVPDIPSFPSFPDPPTSAAAPKKTLPGSQPTPFTSASSSDAFNSAFPNVSAPKITPSTTATPPSYPSPPSYQQPPSVPSSSSSAPASQPRASSSSSFTPSEKDLELAMKFSKFVVSSLQFDDVPSAVKNAKLVLKHLTGMEY